MIHNVHTDKFYMYINVLYTYKAHSIFLTIYYDLRNILTVLHSIAVAILFNTSSQEH